MDTRSSLLFEAIVYRLSLSSQIEFYIFQTQRLYLTDVCLVYLFILDVTQIGITRILYPLRNFEIEMLRLLTRPLYLSATPSSSLRFKQGLALSSRKMATSNTPDFVRAIFNHLHVLTWKLLYYCRTKSCMHHWQRSILK